MYQAQIVSLLISTKIKEGNNALFHNLSQKIISEETVPNTFNQASLTIIPKSDKR